MKKKKDKKDKKFNLQSHQRMLTIVFGLFCLFIIPIYSISLGSKGDWFLHSLSAVGGELGYFGDLVFWGVLIGTFYMFFMGYMFTLVEFKNRRVKICFTIGCITLCIAVFIPFTPKVIPVLSKIHEILSMGATLIMIVAIYFFVLSIGYKDRKIFNRAIWALIGITLITVEIYFLVGISSLIEVFVVSALGIFLFILSLALRKSKYINADENYKAAYVERLKKREEQIAKRQKEIEESTETSDGSTSLDEASPSDESPSSDIERKTPTVDESSGIATVRDTESKPSHDESLPNDTEQTRNPLSGNAAQEAVATREDESEVAQPTNRVTRYHVSLREDGKWQVKREKASKALKLFDTQAEALNYAKSVAVNQETNVVIHKRDGKIRKKKYK